MRAARLMVALDHQNIVKLFEVREFENWLLLITEYVRGVPLPEKVAHGTHVDRITPIDAQIRDVLGYLKSRRIAPPPLGPDNVLVTDDDIIKVLASTWIDFRLA